MVKSLYLSFDEKDFKKLKDKKEEAENKSKVRIRWEDFVFNCVCGK